MVKAAVLVTRNKIEIRDIPMPNDFSNTMLVKVKASGVCGTDPHIYDGSRVGAIYPTVLGHEICGKVEKIGENYKIRSYDNIKVGDRIAIVPGITCGKCYYCKTLPHMENLCIDRKIYGVTMDSSKEPHLVGGFAEHVILNSNYWIFKLPNGISDEVGSLVEPLAVAIRSFERALAPGLPYASMGFGPGSNVVIQGAGPIGILTTMVAKIMGAHVITLDVLEHRLKMAKEFGAADVLNIKDISSEDRIRKIKEMTNGVGADIVIECAGTIEAFEEGVQMVRRGGRYIEMGNFADVGYAKVKPSYICRNDIEIIGSVIASPWDFKRAIYILSNYNYPFEKMITHKFKIEDAEKAVHNVLDKNGIKTIIVP